MRFLAIMVAGVLVASPAASADPRGDDSERREKARADSQARGERFAKEGRFADAIEAFKEADRIDQRASHACLIALAYTRRELWSQAQIFLAACQARASASDPLPDWAPLAEKQIQDRLASARNVAEVAIEVRPAAGAQVTVSSFAPDEKFEPRTIHLPFGTHVIFATVNGQTRQQTLEIKDPAPRRVVIDFGAPGPTNATPGPSATSPSGPLAPTPGVDAPRRPSTTLGTTLLIGGGVLGVIGVISHVSMKGHRDELIAAQETNDLARYQEHETPFERTRAVAIGGYVVGAALIVTGVILRRNARREAAQISAIPLPEGGAFVSVGWSR